MASMQKKAVVIQDICCAGKCSLTIALPVLSAAGVSCSILPTAVMSTHTGGFSSVHARDLTADILPIVHHWKREGLSFDALYSGYLYSSAQIETVRGAMELLRRAAHPPLMLVDPAMGDGGTLYRLCTPDMVAKMADLCARADLIVPNVTEAAFLVGAAYQPPPHTRSYIENLLNGLSKLCKGSIVLTGVGLTPEELGCVCLEGQNGSARYMMEQREKGAYHGTGDLFASALLGGLLNGLSLEAAVRPAMALVRDSISKTRRENGNEREGVLFEPCLEAFSRRLSAGRETNVSRPAAESSVNQGL